ncbi:MAG: PorP/SprF family type IX secretion system membrane protein [Saprospiraceae bacterium]
MSQNITHISRVFLSCAALMLFMLTSSMLAQDLSYSQFYNQPVMVNPGLTGIFNGDHRIITSFRDQARNIPVPYLTFTGFYDRKIYNKNSNKDFFGIGGVFNYDRQGDSNLRLINLNVSGSYSRILNKSNIISLGVLIGYANRAFDPVALTWDSQFDTQTGSFNQSLPSGETFNFESFNYLETGIGLNYRWQKTERTHVDFGFGAFHITNPQDNFLNGVTESLPMRLSLYGILEMQIADNADIQFDVMHKWQTVFRQFLFGSYVNFYLNNQRGKNYQFRVGGGYKTTAEVYFIKAGFQMNQLFVAASYDIDNSQFGINDIGSPGKGPEIHLRYIIKNVKPEGRFKICPIF